MTTANTGEPGTTAPNTPRRGRVPADVLANRLLLARKLAGLTIDDAAEAAGLNPSSWANWEKGMRPQRELDVLGAIAEALDVDFNWLAFGGALESPVGRPVGKRVPKGVRKLGSPTSTRPFGPCADRPKVRNDPQPMATHSGPGRRAVILTQATRS